MKKIKTKTTKTTTHNFHHDFKAPSRYCLARRLFVQSALVLLAGCLSGAAQAQLNFTLSPDDLGVATGNAVTQTYTATLTNLYNYDLYLNGDYFTLDAPLTLDDSKFVNTFILPVDGNGNLLPQPTLAANGGSLTLDVFDLTVPIAQDGIYEGVFGIQHGMSSGDTADVTAANFVVEINTNGTVSSTPEPGVAALLTGVVLPAFWYLRRRRTR